METAVGDAIPEALGAHWCERDDLPETWDIVDELSTFAGIPRPTLWLWDVDEPNAMATGDHPTRASITVTSGLLDVLNGLELRAVLAHEIGHIASGDVVAGTRMAYQAAAAVGAVQAAAMEALAEAAATETELDDMIALIAGTRAVGAAHKTALRQLAAFSRRRELAADAYAVKAGGSARALASALSKMNTNSDDHDDVPRWVRILLTVDHHATASHPAPEVRIKSLGFRASGLLARKGEQTCPRCRFTEKPSASECRRCHTELLDLRCPCGARLDLEHAACPRCQRPSPSTPCRRCGRPLEAGRPVCDSCFQPQDPDATPIRVVRNVRRPGDSLTLTRTARRRLQVMISAVLERDEGVDEFVAGVTAQTTEHESAAGSVVLTTRKLLFISADETVAWALPRNEITLATTSRWRTGKLTLTGPFGGIEITGIRPRQLAVAFAEQLMGHVA